MDLRLVSDFENNIRRLAHLLDSSAYQVNLFFRSFVKYTRVIAGATIPSIAFVQTI